MKLHRVSASWWSLQRSFQRSWLVRPGRSTGPPPIPASPSPTPAWPRAGAETFGAPGQMLITGDFDIDLQYVSQTLNDLSLSGTDITDRPLADVLPGAATWRVGRRASASTTRGRRRRRAASSTSGRPPATTSAITPRMSHLPDAGPARTSGGKDQPADRRRPGHRLVPALCPGAQERRSCSTPSPTCSWASGPSSSLDFMSKVEDAGLRQDPVLRPDPGPRLLSVGGRTGRQGL